MESHEIEDMLYDRAVRSKLRAPTGERLVNLGYNRIVGSGVVAGAALVCTLAMTATGTQTNSPSVSSDAGRTARLGQPEIAKALHMQQPSIMPPQNGNPLMASISMAR